LTDFSGRTSLDDYVRSGDWDLLALHRNREAWHVNCGLGANELALLTGRLCCRSYDLPGGQSKVWIMIEADLCGIS
jgi:hypothetical protein